MRRLAAAVTAGLVAALAAVPLAAPASAASSTPALTVTVSNMIPWTPVASKTVKPLTITVSLTNTTGSDVNHVVLSAGRGEPVGMQSALDTSLSDHTLPTGLQPISAHPADRTGVDVPAGGGPVTATFRTTSTKSTPCRLCLYANAVYPIYISAVDAQTGALLGYTRTYIASTDGGRDGAGNKLSRIDVAWVWPLLDAPHRLANSHVFTDYRSLVGELSPGGRLSRALQVVEDVGLDHPMTLVLDPDLIDELAILSAGNYSYLSASGKTVAGTKVTAAQTWLTHLRSVLSFADVRAEFTPYADPDIQSRSTSDLTWHARVPSTMLARVRRALGLTVLPSTMSFPPGGTASERTLTRIAANGATSVLLDNTSVRPTNTGGLPVSTARLHTPRGTLSAALTSPALQSAVAASMRHGEANDLSHLPSLLAELAVRADTEPYGRRAAFLAAPRYVDPDVSAADTVIRETTSSTFSEASFVQGALAEGVANDSTHSRARHVSASTPGLSRGILRSAQRLTQSLPALNALLTGPNQSPGAEPLLTSLDRGLQRVESGAYLPTSTRSSPSAGTRQATRLRRQVAGLLAGVHIVRAEPGHSYSYTLASRNSPLPITIDNSSAYRAFVHIDVQTAGGLPGLTTTDLGTLSIAPDSKQTFRVPAHVQRSGRIALIATLTTAHDAHVLGPPVRLTVHSTVVGTIGIVITVIAAVVLFLALALRYIRRIQRLRRKRRASSDDARIPARIG